MLLLDKKKALPQQDLKECDPSVWLKVVLFIHEFQLPTKNESVNLYLQSLSQVY